MLTLSVAAYLLKLLAGISSVYLAQDKRREALEALRQSQAIRDQIGMAARSDPNGGSVIDQIKAAGTAAR